MTTQEQRNLLAAVTVLVVGLFSDGWAHANIVDELEGFVTPWHGVVLLGYVLTAGVVLRAVARRRRPGVPLRAAVPGDVRPAVSGVVLFAVGFNGDAVWHGVFGLESDLEALLSPTHLLMAVALVLLASCPYRALAAGALDGEGDGDVSGGGAWRGVVSLLLATLVVAFFLLYLWVTAFEIGSPSYRAALPTGPDGGAGFLDEVSQIAVLASTLVLTALVLVPLLLVLRLPAVPSGAPSALVLLPALGAAGVRELSNGWSLLAFLVAAVVAELVVGRAAGRRRVVLLGVLVPFALWVTYWCGFAVVHGLGWEVELYTGQVVSAVLLGVGLAALATPGGGPEHPAATAEPCLRAPSTPTSP